MLWSGSSPVSVVRGNVWGLMLLAGVAWLAMSWSVLRLEPVEVAGVAGPMVLFGALCEMLRALAGTRMWWLNAGMAVLFAATGVTVLTVVDSTFVTPASLVGWFLMVRGAADVAVSAMNRGVDRTWGLVMLLGVVEAGLGFFATGPLSVSGDFLVVTLGGLGLLRGVADLVTALRLREVAVTRDVLALSSERVAGYAAGRQDYEAVQTVVDDAQARHRAAGGESFDPDSWAEHPEVRAHAAAGHRVSASPDDFSGFARTPGFADAPDSADLGTSAWPSPDIRAGYGSAGDDPAAGGGSSERWQAQGGRFTS